MNCPHCHTALPVFRNPVPTVDIIIEIDGDIVLIKRQNPPYGWALPGGFVDYGESYEHAALREAVEETGLAVQNLTQFHTYSDPSRDPRQHTASTVFIGQACNKPKAGDDAAEAGLFSENNLPDLVFDHARILTDYFASKRIKATIKPL
jgi:ADP-ribose pyrophosphatase YjhB (NUDIX family)